MNVNALLKLLVPILGAGTVALIITVVTVFKKAQKTAAKGKKEAKPGEKAAAHGDAAAAPPAADSHTMSMGSVLDLRRSFAAGISALGQWAPRASDRLRAPWVLSIGREGAGKSALLQGLTLDRLGGWSGTTGPVGEAPCRFHFFEHGVVLDLSGSLLGHDGMSFSREATWKALITLLQRHRAERPADAVVLSIAITDLVGPQRLAGDALDREASRVQRAMQQLSLGLGLQLPVYVLVTQCDRIPGFSALSRSLPPSRRQEVLGWSSPYALGMTFTPEWIDEAVAVVSRGIQDAEFALWVGDEPPVDGDDLASLPNWIAAAAPALRSHLGRVFRMTAYDPAYALRGVYFVGDDDRAPRIMGTPERAAAAAIEPPNLLLGPSDAEAQPVQPVFAADLFRDKIFAEHGLARVARRTALSKNRKVAIMQMATAALLLLGPVGLWAAANGVGLGSVHVTDGVRAGATSLTPLLDSIEIDGRNLLDNRSESRVSIFALLDEMASVRSSALRSVFLPASLVSPLHSNIRDAIQHAFGGIVFPEFLQQLHGRTEAVLANTPSARARSLPEYLTELQSLGENIARYNAMGTAGAGSTRDLAALVEYLYPNEPLSPGFFDNDDYYREALEETSVDPIVISPAQRATALRRAQQLTADSYNALVARLSASAEVVVPDSEVPASDSESDDSGMERLRADVSAVVALRAFLDTAGPVEHDLAAFKRPFVFGDDFAPQVHAALSYYRKRLTGELSSERFAGAQWSGASLRALDGLLRQPFMQAATGSEIPTEIDDGTMLRWDVQRLDQAIALYNDYDKFIAHGLDSLADGVRGNVRRLATAQVATAMGDLIAGAAVIVPASTVARNQSARDLQARMASFDQSLERVSRILDLFDTMGATPLVDALDALETAHASNLLARIDAYTNVQGRFVLSPATLATWNGQAPFSAVLGTPEAGLADYLGGDLEALRSGAALARSAVMFLDGRDGVDERTARSVTAWRDVLDAIDRADQKPPSGPLAMLDHTAAEVDSIDARTCVRRPVHAAATNSLLARRISELRQAVWRRCSDVATGAARTSYAQLEATFRTKLAGRFPFSATADAADANPADVRAFFREYDALSPDVVPASGAAAPRVAAFLNALGAARRFFAPLLDSAARPLEFEYQIDFRANRGAEVGGNQIAAWTADIGTQHASIDDADAARRGVWHSGDTVQVTLRWATGSLVVPVDAPGRGASVENGAIDVGAGGRWGLLRLLRAYATDLSDGASGQMIAIGARTARRQAPAEPNGSARVFIRIRLFNPDTKAELDMPTFPVTAPEVVGVSRR